MEGVGTHHCLRCVTVGSYRLEVGGAQVHRHGLDQRRTLGAELIGERIEGLGVAARGTPDDPGAVVIHDQGQVLVMLTPADLVDADAEQALETVRVELDSHDPFTRTADGAPAHPAQPGDRALVHPRGQPRQQVVEVAAQVRARSSERHSLGDHTMGRAGQPPQLGSHLDPPHSQIEVPPPR